MKRFQICLTVVWIGLGLFVSAYSLRLGLGALVRPGPGLFPFCLGLIIALLALYKLLSKQLRKDRDEEGTGGPEGSPQQAPVGRLAVLAITLFAYALLLETLGYIITTFLGLAVLLRTGGYEKWIPIVVYALIISAVTYFGFTYLGTMFPPGILRHVGMH